MQRQKRSRFNALAKYLNELPQDVNSIIFTIEELEKIVGELSKTARTSRSYWGNTKSRPYARCWMDAGWEVQNGYYFVTEGVKFVRKAQS